MGLSSLVFDFQQQPDPSISEERWSKAQLLLGFTLIPGGAWSQR